jgi:hypothetical protein
MAMVPPTVVSNATSFLWTTVGQDFYHHGDYSCVRFDCQNKLKHTGLQDLSHGCGDLTFIWGGCLAVWLLSDERRHINSSINKAPSTLLAVEATGTNHML